MGNDSSKSVAVVKAAPAAPSSKPKPAPERKAAIAVVTQTTVSRLADAARAAHGTSTDLCTTSPDMARLLSRAQQCAARGGAPLVKDELVHLVALLQALRANKALDTKTYAVLGVKTVEELYCLVRLLMYNPDLCRTVSSVSSTSTTLPVLEPSAPPPSSTSSSSLLSSPESTAADTKQEVLIVT